MKYRIGCLVVLIFIVLLFVRQNNYEGFKKDPCDTILEELDEVKSSLDQALNSTKDAAGEKVKKLSTEYKDIFNKAIDNKCDIPKPKSKKGVFST